MNNVFRRLAPIVALSLPLAALAQPTRIDPADPKAAAPALRYLSAFADYKPWQDVQPGNWRALNDSLGGPSSSDAHAGHAMQAAPAASAPQTTAPVAGQPSHAGHSHHHGGQR